MESILNKVLTIPSDSVIIQKIIYQIFSSMKQR